MAEKIVAGIPLARYYPDLRDSILLCVTETTRKEQIDRLVKGLVS
jgi:glycine dehydrogenase subunit 1